MLHCPATLISYHQDSASIVGLEKSTLSYPRLFTGFLLCNSMVICNLKAKDCCFFSVITTEDAVAEIPAIIVKAFFFFFQS